MSALRLVIAAAVLVSAAACGNDPTDPSPLPPDTPPADGPAITIPVGAETLGNRAYMPAELDVAVGATVTWVNGDSIPHTSTSDAPGWSSGIVGPGGRFSRTFQTAGTFPYHCSLHPGMVGSVVVR
jgi:plastocyanin